MSGFVLFLSACRVTSGGPAQPGRLEEHSRLQLQRNIECMGNKFGLLFIDMALHGPAKQRNVHGSFSS